MIGTIPAYPMPPSGFTDITSSFASATVGKTIYIKSVRNGKYLQNSQPTGNTNALFLSDNKGVNEEFSVHPFKINGTWEGDVCLKSEANGKWLRTNGSVVAAASVPSSSTVANDSIFRIYRNNANGKYFLRVKSTGNYMAVNMDSSYRDSFLTTTQPDGNGINLDWERFEIEVKPAYAASSILETGYYAIQHKTSGKYVSAANGTSNGIPVILYQDGNGSAPGIADDQQFYFEQQSDGAYRITSRRSGLALPRQGLYPRFWEDNFASIRQPPNALSEIIIPGTSANVKVLLPQKARNCFREKKSHRTVLPSHKNRIESEGISLNWLTAPATE